MYLQVYSKMILDIDENISKKTNSLTNEEIWLRFRIIDKES